MVKKSEKNGSKIKVTLVKSVISCLEAHKACVRGLGLRRINHSVEVMDNPMNRGMITRVSYLLKVEEAK